MHECIYCICHHADYSLNHPVKTNTDRNLRRRDEWQDLCDIYSIVSNAFNIVNHLHC